MIRRPSRTALQSALSALAGGLRGTAIQRQQEEQRKQLGLENERAALRTALDLAEVGAEVQPPDAAPEPAGMPAPPPITFGGQTYRVPSAAERARRVAEAQQKVAEEQREAENRRAYGALRAIVPTAAPEMEVGDYDPNVSYADVLGNLPSYRRTSAPTTPTPRPMTAGQQAAENAKERIGDGFLAEFGNAASPKYSADEIARFWNAFDLIKRQNPGLSEGRMAYDAYQSLSLGTRQSATRDAAEQTPRAESPAPIAPSFPPPPGGSAVTPARPAQPVTAPARPAVPAGGPATAAEIQAAFAALGSGATNEDIQAWIRRRRAAGGR